MRKKFGRICALVVVGMFVVMTSMSTSANDPDDWTIGGDAFGGGTTQTLGTLSPDDLSIITGGEQRIIIGGVGSLGLVGIGLAPGIFPVNTLDVAGNMAVGEFFAGMIPAPPNGMIIEGWVGIGTPIPMEALDVEGNIHTSGSFIAGSTTTYGNGFITLSSGTNLNIDSGTLFIDNANDRVGIGTTNPAEKLDVAGTVQMTGFKMTTGASSGYVLTSDASGQGTWQPAPSGGIGGSGTTNYIPKFTGSTTLGDSVIYESGGKIGIGKSSPGAMLDVAGAIKSSISIPGTVLFRGNNEAGAPVADGFRMRYDADFFGTNYDALIVEKTDGNREDPDGGIAFVNTGSDGVVETAMVIKGNGRVGIGTMSPGDILDVNGDIRVRGADIKDAGGTARITLTDNGRLDLKEDGGSTSLSIATDGKVGIGTTSPAYTLDVNGDVDMSGYILWPETDSSSGRLHTKAGHRETASSGTILETDRIKFRTTGTGGQVKVTPKGLDIDAYFSSSLRGAPDERVITDGNFYTYTLEEGEIGWFCWDTDSGPTGHGMFFMHRGSSFITIYCLGEYDQSG